MHNPNMSNHHKITSLCEVEVEAEVEDGAGAEDGANGHGHANGHGQYHISL